MNGATPHDDSVEDPPSTNTVDGANVSKQAPKKEPYLATPISAPFEGATRGRPVPPLLTRQHLQSSGTTWWIPALLLVATCISTFFAGAMSWEPQVLFKLFQADIAASVMMSIRQSILRHAGQGSMYMFCVIAILFAHEMGHYVATRIYKVPSTLPFFIPFPIAPFGTMGAVIAMKGQQANRREIFDIGIAGPLAGLVLAVPILWLGVAQLDLTTPGFGTYRYDLPLLVRWIYSIVHPNSPGVTEVHASQVNAMFMAGWVGLLITGLNMLPVSQLDGGHITYTLFGRHSRWIARVFVGIAIGYMVINQVYIWTLMLVLIFFIGLYHPPTSDDRVQLGVGRVVLGLLSLLIPVLCFPPRGLIPFYTGSGDPGGERVQLQ